MDIHWSVDAVLRSGILEKRLDILRQILIAIDFYLFYLYFREVPSIQKKQKHLLRKVFGSFHSCNWMYLLRNYSSNYMYLKDMYITSKRTEKILFVSVLRILPICKFLTFPAVFTKKNFPCEKVIFSLIHPTYVTIHGF